MNKPPEEIIDYVLNNTASKDDAILVAKWFSTPEGQKYLSMRMDSEYLFQGELFNIDQDDILSEEIYEVIQKKIKRKRVKRIIFSAAAVIVPFVLLIYGALQLDTRVGLFGESEYQEIYVPKGERMQVMFQDGTKAYLNSDTRLRYPKKFGLTERIVYLEGEAYFIVEKNITRPFIVQADSATVQVLGTSFNVEAYPDNDNISVSLDEGKVNLQPISEKKRYALEPQEKLVFNKLSKSCVIMAYEKNTDYSSLWKNDIIAFNNKPLDEVVKVLNRWYNVDFIISDNEALLYSYTLVIAKETPLEKVLQDLEKVAPVRFYFDGNAVTVSMEHQ